MFLGLTNGSGDMRREDMRRENMRRENMQRGEIPFGGNQPVVRPRPEIPMGGPSRPVVPLASGAFGRPQPRQQRQDSGVQRRPVVPSRSQFPGDLPLAPDTVRVDVDDRGPAPDVLDLPERVPGDDADVREPVAAPDIDADVDGAAPDAAEYTGVYQAPQVVALVDDDMPVGMTLPAPKKLPKNKPVDLEAVEEGVSDAEPLPATQQSSFLNAVTVAPKDYAGEDYAVPITTALTNIITPPNRQYPQQNQQNQQNYFFGPVFLVAKGSQVNIGDVPSIGGILGNRIDMDLIRYILKGKAKSALKESDNQMKKETIVSYRIKMKELDKRIKSMRESDPNRQELEELLAGLSAMIQELEAEM